MSFPAAADGSKVLLGKGKVFFNRFDANGVSGGERFLGNCTKLEISTEDDVIELKDSTTAAAATLAKVNRERKVNVAISMSEFDKENLGLALMGDSSPLVQTSATVTDEAIKSCGGDKYIPLANRDLTSVTNVKKGATTYVAGTDYEVDLVQGRIYVKAGGAIDLLTHPDSLTCTYVKAAITRQRVRGAISGKIEGTLRFVADPTTGPIWDAEVWKLSVNPDGVVSLIGDEFGEMSLTGQALSDGINHPTEPFYRLIQR